MNDKSNLTPLRDSARQAVALLPCPFCGGESLGESVRQDNDEDGPFATMFCLTCRAETPVAAWNRRVRALPDGEEPARYEIRGRNGSAGKWGDWDETDRETYDHFIAKPAVCWQARALYATPAHATRVGEWLPIESAPREFGSRVIMGFAPDEENYSPPSYEGYWSEARQRWCLSSDPNWNNSPQPTHWQPLPAPPAATQHPAAVVGEQENSNG